MTTIVTKIILGYLNNEWKTQRKSGVVLTTSEIMHEMQEKFNQAWNNLLKSAESNGTLYKCIVTR